MKRLIPIILFFLAGAAHAHTTIRISANFLAEITRKVEFKTNLSFIERLLLTQIVNNTSVNGVKLKKYNTNAIMNYFNKDGNFTKIGPNKLLEPKTGATLEFDSDGKCKGSECIILVDFNGDKGPNKLWTDLTNPKDRVILTVKKSKGGSLEIILPEFSR